MVEVASHVARHLGVVKSYDLGKGFGFIIVSGNPQDIFLHISEIRKAGIRGPVKPTQEFSFEIVEGPKGLRATNLQRNA